jgi:hypothetical protein
MLSWENSGIVGVYVVSGERYISSTHCLHWLTRVLQGVGGAVCANSWEV